VALFVYLKSLNCNFVSIFSKSLHGAPLTRRSSNWAGLAEFFTGDGLLDRDLLVEALQGILALELLQLDRCVLIEELVNREVATAHADVDLVLLNFDRDSLGTELVDAVRLAHEHDLQLLTVGEVVDVLSEALVNGVAPDRDVHSDARLQVDDVLLNRWR
jgi:hypothetical protein